MENLEITNQLLSQILDELRLLTASQKISSYKRFQKDFLTTDARRQIYAEFNGSNSFQQIAELTGQKRNTVQIFAQILVDKKLVDVELNGTSKIIIKSASKIANYYANLDVQNEDVKGE